MIVVRTKAMKFWMKEAGFKNQSILAAKLGMDRSRLNKIINNRTRGHLSLSTIDRICFILKCQPGDILEHVSNSG